MKDKSINVKDDEAYYGKAIAKKNFQIMKKIIYYFYSIIQKINEIDVGKFYISLIAETHKGKIYEYYFYNPYEFLNSSEYVTIDTNINENESFNIGRYSKSFIYRAKIYESNEDFIKLNIKDQNITEENNYIYVRSEKSFEKAEYKEL